MFKMQIIKGIQWMEKFDKNWYNKINLSKLCMFNNEGCVLSQWLGGNPYDIIDSDNWYLTHGFTISSKDENYSPENWFILKQEWTDIILEKRKSLKSISKIK